MSDTVGRRDLLKAGVGALGGLFAGSACASATGQRLNKSVAPIGPETVQSQGRIGAAFSARMRAAQAEQRRGAVAMRTNGDEGRYPSFAANFSKGLPHSSIGEPTREAFHALVKAAETGLPTDFEAIPTAGVVRLVNPQAAFAFTLEGPDPHTLPLPSPPPLASAELAAEACELYWQALTRDVPFSDYASNETIQRACLELSRLSSYRGPKTGGAVTPDTIFRGATAGDLSGPYISQFLWKEVPYGAIRLVPHVRTSTPGLDYLITWDDWLQVQNGAATVARHAGTYRYIRSARDLAAYVQLDFSYQAFLTACLVLFGMEGTTDVRRPYKGAPFDSASPYRLSKTQSGFSTFGVAQALDLVARVANLALRHAWYHKWIVHRYLRPEEFGGRVHVHRTGMASYPLSDDILSSEAVELTFQRHRSYLLPQAYPEGSPLHPSYPSGHAAIAGACTTVLKAFFEESFPIEEPVVARADGLTLEPYRGPTITVGGELNKLAANLSIGRGSGGIHWRSDSVGGLLLGESVAIELLREMRGCFHEDFSGFALTCFDGTQVTI
jgi:membrane-associated phospholipid phosphatase